MEKDVSYISMASKISMMVLYVSWGRQDIKGAGCREACPPPPPRKIVRISMHWDGIYSDFRYE
jgi:hypothetical protein